MTTPDPARFTTDAAVPSAPTLKVMFRAEEPSDRTYILSCWNEGWKDAPENRDLLEPAEAKMLRDTAYDPDDLLRQTNAMTSRKYRKKFQELVVGGDGVLWHPRTKVMVGCSPEERGWIWAFCVFTPATKDEPAVIHWMTVRPNLRDAAGGKRSIRREGIATRMLGIGTGPDGNILGPGLAPTPGKLTPMLYTCRPGRQRSFQTGAAWEVWGDLVEALFKIGIKADYVPLEDWLARRHLGVGQ